MHKVTLTCTVRGIREPCIFYMYFYERPTIGELERICQERHTWAEDWSWSNLVFDRGE